MDLDDLIVERAGKTLPQILRQDGLEAFYALESDVGMALDRENTVVATGGSMVPVSYTHLRAHET